MPIKLIALYTQPSDEAAFLTHFEQIHVPLVEKMPHLEQVVINRVVGTPFGDPAFFMIVELHFPDRERFDIAMNSDENREAGRDVVAFAKGLVTLIIVQSN